MKTKFDLLSYEISSEVELDVKTTSENSIGKK